MRRIHKVLLFAAATALIVGGAAYHLHRYPAYLHLSHRIIVARWLLRHPEMRLARPEDCGDCQEAIGAVKANSSGDQYNIPGFTPYYSRGDFNRDGREDFAVAIIDTKQNKFAFTVLIFNGPLNALKSMPAFQQDGLELRGGGLFFFPNRTINGNALIAGPFESDNTVLFKPVGATYEMDEGEED